MGKGGVRSLQDEKGLLSELGKLFHLARANAREQRNAHRARGKENRTGLSAKPKKSLKEGGQQEEKGPKKSRKRARGGTVWIVLKGGFANVPTSEKTGAIARNAAFRGRLSERRRLQSLEEAEQYVQTAWQQAQEASLLLEDGSGPSGEDGLQYLREQYEVAASMLRREPCGSYLKQMVDLTVPSQVAAPQPPSSLFSSAPAGGGKAGKTLFTEEEWAGIIARENVILKRFALPRGGTGGGGEEHDDGDLILHEAAQVSSRYYFPIAEPLASTEASAADPTTGHLNTSGNASRVKEVGDVLPTKCIIRIRGSGKHKHTAILTSPKSVKYFKSNFIQVIRKELSASKLPRGEDITEGKQQHQQQQQQQQHPHSSTAAAGGASGSSKKNFKKRHK